MRFVDQWSNNNFFKPAETTPSDRKQLTYLVINDRIMSNQKVGQQTTFCWDFHNFLSFSLAVLKKSNLGRSKGAGTVNGKCLPYLGNFVRVTK